MLVLKKCMFTLASLGLLTLASTLQSAPVKIGVMADMSGSYSDIGGKGLVEAAKMAAEDFGGTVLGEPIQVVYADGQNKVDVASATARRWFDQEGVDVITDLPTSAIAFAVNDLGRSKKKIILATSASSSDLTGSQCSPYMVHWTYDTYALAKGTAQAVLNRGGKKWFFVSADYSFGTILQNDASQVINSKGGKVLGSVRSPFGTLEFSSFLLQAQSSGSEVIGFALGGNDLISAVKQSADFGIGKRLNGQTLVALLGFLTDVKSIGLELGQGLLLTEAFYWDQNEKTRAWSKRFYDRVGRMPTMTQAGTYTAITHYLNAVKEVGSKDPDAVMKKMRETKINDFMTTNGYIRADGRAIRDMYLFEAKKPSESKGPWDLYNQLAVIPGEEAFRPLKDGGCSFIK